LAEADFCGQAHDGCAGAATRNAAGQALTTIASRTQNPDATWSPLTIDCAAAAITAAVPAAAVQASFVKLLPHLPISSAPGNGQSLVNAETLFWIPTTATRTLATTTLLGHQIGLYANIASVTWNFGDDTTATNTGPGRAFTPTDHCNTPQCPDWFGHTYTSTATHLTITATITWTGRYNTDNGPLLPIPGTVTTTPTPIPMRVVQARTILVPNPNDPNTGDSTGDSNSEQGPP
jgi:hypothetical protein